MKRNIRIQRFIEKGSLTIEAALVLPIFVFMMVCVMSLSSLLLFQLCLKSSMTEEMKVIAMKSEGGDFLFEEDIAGDVLRGIEEGVLAIAPIEGGRDGIEFSDEGSTGEVLRLKAGYRAKLYYDFFKLFNRSFVQEAVFHNWKGYEYGMAHSISTIEEEYVYITESGEVYHRSRNCSHIRLSISQILAGDIESARNTDGARYKSCEHCHSSLSDGTLYITADGDKYHNSLGCSALKRTVRAIPISETGDRRPCSRCGGL